MCLYCSYSFLFFSLFFSLSLFSPPLSLSIRGGWPLIIVLVFDYFLSIRKLVHYHCPCFRLFFYQSGDWFIIVVLVFICFLSIRRLVHYRCPCFHSGVALPFRDLRQPTRNITYFASVARKMQQYNLELTHITKPK